jgi:type II secretory pathway pseudopilin PulG
MHRSLNSLNDRFRPSETPLGARWRRARASSGYAMAVLVVGIGMMMIMLTVAMPVWHQTMQREKEEELIFRGTQYARAVVLYQRNFAGGYPASIDVLVQQRFLRKKYKDPMTEDGEFQLIPAGAMQAGQAGVSLSTTTAGRGQTPGRGSSTTSATSQSGFAGQTTVVGGLVGVVSKSTDKSIKLYNGRDHYNEWLFVSSARAGQGGVTAPGRGRGGQGQGGRGGNQPGPGGDIFGPGGGRGGRGRGGFGPGPGQGTFDPTQFPPAGGGRGPGRGGQP